jgi:hypothetical protein
MTLAVVIEGSTHEIALAPNHGQVSDAAKDAARTPVNAGREEELGPSVRRTDGNVLFGKSFKEMLCAKKSRDVFQANDTPARFAANCVGLSALTETAKSCVLIQI